jgi:hypothetical protein
VLSDWKAYERGTAGEAQLTRYWQRNAGLGPIFNTLLLNYYQQIGLTRDGGGPCMQM